MRLTRACGQHASSAGAGVLDLELSKWDLTLPRIVVTAVHLKSIFGERRHVCRVQWMQFRWGSRARKHDPRPFLHHSSSHRCFTW